MAEEKGGSFLTGFTVGLFAGAAGYFLFGTDQGKKVKSKLEEEWHEAKYTLAQDGVIESPDVSVKQLFSKVFKTVSEKLEESQTETKASSKKTAKKSAPKKQRKFKNIEL